MKIIIDFWQKCKGEWFLGLVLVLVAGAAFGLGRWSEFRPKSLPVTITQAPTENSSKNQQIPNLDKMQSGVVVGSRQGSKYHFPTCAGAKSIKPENRVEFPNIAAARAAGYTPAANCPGLN